MSGRISELDPVILPIDILSLFEISTPVSPGVYTSEQSTLSDFIDQIFDSSVLTGTPIAPTVAPGTNNTQLATTAYTDAAVAAIIAASDAMVFKGVIDCSTNPNYPAADRGHTYRVSVAGKIGGASGPNVEVGDLLVCLIDGTASGTHAAVGAQWTISQTNLDGAVIGPASAVDSRIAAFDGTTGKLIKDGGINISALLVSGGNIPIRDTSAVFDVILAATSAPVLNSNRTLTFDMGNVAHTLDLGDTANTIMFPNAASYTLAGLSVANIWTALNTFKNTTDSASVEVLHLEGDRATPANNDQIYQSWVLSDSAGVQTEFGRIRLQAIDITDGSEDARFLFSLYKGGTFTNIFGIGNNAIFPDANDLISLGSAGLGFSDLFLASGGVINWNNGNATLTHSAGVLTSSVELALAAGKSLAFKTGTGARAGDAVLIGGTVTVTNTTVTANTKVILSRKTIGGTVGNMSYTLSAGASFTINSSSGTDTSTISYVLVELN